MICNDNFVLWDTEEKLRLYKYDRCVCYACYPCELVTEYELVKKNNLDTETSFYIQDEWDTCIMRDIVRIECGGVRVTNDIGDDFKIDLVYKYKKDHFKIVKGPDTGRWEPEQPVFISAPTGQGKITS